MSDPAPTVFIVDDEECVRKAFSRLLRSAGYRVAVFGSAGEFLEKFEPEATGCLLLDVAMPEISGPKLQQILATRDAARPIIFLTGQDDAPISLEARNQGTVGFLTKPVEAKALFAAVAKAIRQDRLSRIARQASA